MTDITTDISGNWFTSFGPMTLTRDRDVVTGTYGRTEPLNTLRGRADGNRIAFEYTEPREQGTGWFDVVREGHFVGEYLAHGTAHPRPWNGNRGFDGLWQTTIGMLRLAHQAGLVNGRLDGGAGFEGTLRDGRLSFRDLVPGPKGEGWLEIDATGEMMAGQWRGEGEAEAVEIAGRRALAEPRAAWLIVLEAHWQRSLVEREFAFGDMLDEIFARQSHVNVRHRYFNDETSLLHWCSALQFLAEPVVVVITSHGEPEGIVVGGRIVDSRKVIEALRPADSLRLLHFSSCLVARNGGTGLANPSFPVSGYTVSVDWMASALTEFTYLDMILGKGLAPEAAAEQVYRLIGFAGAEVAPDCPYPAAGFHFVPRQRPDALPPPQDEVAVAEAGSSHSFLGALDDIRRKLTGQA